MDDTPDTTAAALATLSFLTGGLAHEIRNPLSTLRVNLQLLQEDLRELDPAADSVRRSLRRTDTMKAEIARLSEILDDFIRFVAHHELNIQPVDLNGLVREVVDFFEPQAASAHVRIMTGFSDRPLPARVDADLIKQALLNLMLNAQQAMPDGGELMIRTARCDDRARIDVADTGCGIASDRIGQIFEPYYSTRKGGSGLGLAMTRRIIDEHGGALTVDSTVGRGTRFAIDLPLADTEPQGDDS